eukprot:CAMPEP_0197044778 /NCGR_PEP_ID=MMETSP1384-20130603/20759_1 /TAXON_ID=29189 /ORGANISM="Ammonia sp." /LENGTH=215 /DNA_ID=CAMNT_0042476291 /DNA_START=32 /DNA_END=679 /DNA_ORIENTATION=-
MGNLACNSRKSGRALPVFVEVMNVYPFCGTIDIDIEKKHLQSPLLYCVSNLVDDAMQYLRTYHRNTTYLLHKVIHNNATYLWNNPRLNDILSTALVQNTGYVETDIKLYFVCQQKIDIAVRATYSNAANSFVYHDRFALAILYTNDYSVSDFLADMTRKVNNRRIGHHYEASDVVVEMNSMARRDINEPISLQTMSYMQNHGVNVACFNRDSYEF